MTVYHFATEDIIDLLGWIGGLQAILSFLFNLFMSKFSSIMYVLVTSKKIYNEHEADDDKTYG